ncbi:peptidoglycan-binding domain-containing protein [Streptomyces sp. 7R007]
MTEPNGRLCPECGAPRAADNTPSCACAQRASDALRDARTAEAAAAEDFDPLRIRPYVELESETTGPTPTSAPTPPPPPAPEPMPAPDATMPLRAVPSLPTPLAPPTRNPAAQDLSLFDAGPDTDGDPDAAAPRHDVTPPRPSRTRRPRAVLLAAGGAVVAVVSAAGLASGLFSYDTPTRNTALPDDVRASVPDATTSAASRRTADKTASAAPTTVPAPATSSASPSATPSTPSASATPSDSKSPAVTPSTVTATGTIRETDAGTQSAAPVLRRGDSGPEVVELELRLTQLGLYTKKAQGHYNEGVEDAVTRYQQARGITQDEPGVYGATTRARLESETREP